MRDPKGRTFVSVLPTPPRGKENAQTSAQNSSMPWCGKHGPAPRRGLPRPRTQERSPGSTAAGQGSNLGPGLHPGSHRVQVLESPLL